MTETQTEAQEILKKFEGDLIKACEYVTEIINKGQQHADFWKEVKMELNCVEMPAQVKKRGVFVKVESLSEKEKSIIAEMKALKTFTNSELSERIGIKENDLSPRVRKIKRMGYIEAYGKRQSNLVNRQVIVWRYK